MKKVILAAVIAAATGCAGSAFQSAPEFEMRGNAEGIRAYHDGVVGSLKTAKESADTQNQHMAYRGEQEKEITRRALKPNFLDTLFGEPTKAGNSTAEQGS